MAKWREAIAWCGFLFSTVLGVYNYGMLTIRIGLANEQLYWFYEFREMVKNGELPPKVGISEVQSYYASGTKQIHGSVLDQIVESVRADVISDIQEIENVRGRAVQND